MSLPVKLIIYLALAIGLQQCSKAKKSPIDKPIIIAKVNNDIITHEQFQRKFDQMKMSYDPVSLSISTQLFEIKKSLLNQMITNLILTREAHNHNIHINPEELQDHIDDVKKEFSNESFRQVLLNKNINYSDWVEEQKNFLLLKKLDRYIIESQNIEIADKMIDDYYQQNLSNYKRNEQVRIQQIVVESSQIANQVLNNLKKGADFATMAKQYSLSPDKKNGGDIGYFEKGTKIPEFETAFTLGVGKISKVIPSPYGYHILKVNSIKPAMTLPLNMVKNQIKDKLKSELQEISYKKWLEKKISEAKIYQNHEILKVIN